MNASLQRGIRMLTGMSPLTAATRQHVLVVEDETDLRRLITFVLQRAGCAVTSAGSLAEATELLASEHFDHAIVDLGLPDGRGDQLVPRLRACSPHTRIILTSAYAHASVIGHAAAGAGDGFLAKPFSNRELVALLRGAHAGG